MVKENLESNYLSQPTFTCSKLTINTQKWLQVIMSRTDFRVNPHSIVCLNVKELLARGRRHIWSLSGSNGIRTHNHLVSKRTLDLLENIFACLFSVSNIISLSRHEQVCLIRLRFKGWEKSLSKRSLIKHTCSWREHSTI